ncbi:hypothetical protein [Hymenobacter convexus]|uniref:hypothetical protein n=1 Tax=Hymenobacter sp. CA1UV-4 TaxID=3063782 RepID=UPI002714412E|nr:hypothetical protein [Hymenobacter sp. CA1UV-4]MDO7852955.1 hypothetical protein [Hymenobacter sp. CA1UV-4]
MFQTIPADNRLAALLNQYITHLQEIAEPLAPRISLRTLRFVGDSPSFPTASGIYYHCRVVAAALVNLHDAYVGAIAVLENVESPEVLRQRVAQYFASPDSVQERIGSARPDDLPNLSELLQFAKQQARALGLTRFGGGVVFKALPFGVADKVSRLIADGVWWCELFGKAESAADFERLAHALRKSTGII